MSSNPSSLALMPPHRVYHNFLNSKEHAGLLTWTIENETEFQESTIGREGRLDRSRRISRMVREFGPTKELLRQRVFDFVPTLVTDLRVTPFQPTKVTLELAAHNDGAFYKRHIDTYVGDERRASDRLLSAVYYFYAEPRKFSGGQLRLYSFGDKQDGDNFLDLQPDQNSLVVFPSWVQHEVLPVSCPSRRFSDSRFAVNCWVHR